LKLLQKIVDISICPEIQFLNHYRSSEASKAYEFEAKIYLKILKNPLTNEFIKEHLLRKDRS
jgi:hypothetical protein